MGPDGERSRDGRMPEGCRGHESLEPLPSAFFARDPREVARDLLGCVLASTVDGACAGGRIVETEAYLGSDDPGSHAATKRMTRRNAVMYGPPGSVYVYFTYGNHHMLNLVCLPEGEAGAVLIRAIQPEFGIEAMQARRGDRPLHDLANGPGKLAAALGITLEDNATVVGEGRVIVYDGPRPHDGEVRVTGRVGLSAGHELDYRFVVHSNAYISRGRTGVSRPRLKRANDDRRERA